MTYRITAKAPNKLIRALADIIDKQMPNATCLEIEEMVYVFLQENKGVYKRNNPDRIIVLINPKVIMIAYIELVVHSVIEVYF